MPSLLRSLMLALPIVLVATLTMGTISPVSAMASPGRLPMPLRPADYSGRFAPIAHATRHNDLKKSHVPIRYTGEHAKASTQYNSSMDSKKPTTVYHTVRVPSAHNAFRALRRYNSADLSELSKRRDAVVKSANEMSYLASRSSSGDGVDSNYQQDAATALSDNQASMSGFMGLLGQLAADDGLANYDKSVEFETLMKDVVNASKDVMASTTTMIDELPILGPILAPVMYDIKCLVDDTLDMTENMTDAMANILKPLMMTLNPTLVTVMQALNLPV